jgi:hypothetical protein
MFIPRLFTSITCLALLSGLSGSLNARPLVPNGGFEEGSEGWTLFTPASSQSAEPALQIITSGARSGKKHLRLYSKTNARYAATPDILKVNGGQRYRVSVWVKTSPDLETAVGPIVRVMFREDAPSKVETSFYLDTNGRLSSGTAPLARLSEPLPAQWRKIEAVMQAPAKATSAGMALFAWNTRGSVDFDDFTMEKVSSSTPLTDLAVDKAKQDRDKLAPLSAERIRQVAAWITPGTSNVAPSWKDRAYWENVGRLPAAPGLLKNAADLLGTEPPVLTEELFNDYSISGLRRPYELPNGDRTNRLVTLVLAECISPDQTRLEQIIREVNGIMDEPTWVVPAHASRFPNWHAAREFIDLAASARGWTLANVDWLLADRLPAATRQRIRKEVGERILTPWITRNREGNVGVLWWMKAPMNWSAVCNAGVLGSALLLIDDPKERAEYVVAWEQLNQFFLSGFTADGYCAEGVAYWGYGFGHFVMASELVKHVTGGRIDTLDTDQARTIMAYGPSFEIANRYYPPFSDTTLGSRPDQHILDFAAVRFGLGKVFGPPTLKGYSILGGRIHVALFDLATDRASIRDSGKAPLPLRSWFPHGGALICRGTDADRGLAVAIKGGHNDEPHNHNDLGTFVVVSDGRVALSEIGKDDYTNQTFGDLRYTSSVMNSFGHAVPRVAGKLQSTGSQARAVTVRSAFTPARDLWEIDLSSAYAVPELIKVTRTFTYDRTGSGSLEIIDQASFRSPQAFGIAFALLPGQRWVEDGKDSYLVEGGEGRVRVTVESEATLVRSDELIKGILSTAEPKGLRVGFDLSAPAGSVRIRTLITPAPANP